MTGSFMQLLTPLGGFIQNHKINPQKTYPSALLRHYGAGFLNRPSKAEHSHLYHV